MYFQWPSPCKKVEKIIGETLLKNVLVDHFSVKILKKQIEDHFSENTLKKFEEQF